MAAMSRIWCRGICLRGLSLTPITGIGWSTASTGISVRSKIISMANRSQHGASLSFAWPPRALLLDKDHRVAGRMVVARSVERAYVIMHPGTGKRNDRIAGGWFFRALGRRICQESKGRQSRNAFTVEKEEPKSRVQMGNLPLFCH